MFRIMLLTVAPSIPATHKVFVRQGPAQGLKLYIITLPLQVHENIPLLLSCHMDMIPVSPRDLMWLVWSTENKIAWTLHSLQQELTLIWRVIQSTLTHHGAVCEGDLVSYFVSFADGCPGSHLYIPIPFVKHDSKLPKEYHNSNQSCSQRRAPCSQGLSSDPKITHILSVPPTLPDPPTKVDPLPLLGARPHNVRGCICQHSNFPAVLGDLSYLLCLSFSHCTFLPGFQNLGMDSTRAAKIKIWSVSRITLST